MMAEMGDSAVVVDQLLIDTELVKMASTPNGNNKCIKRLISSNPNSPKGSSSPSMQQSPVTGPTSPSLMMSLTSSQGATEKQSNGQYHGISSSKLGSDGESEASPECSLSPVEVDSLEGGSSRDSSTCDRRSSPDYVNCTHGVDDEEDDGVVADHEGFRECDSSPDAGISGCRPVGYESNSLSPEMLMANSKTTSKGGNINHRRTPSSSSSSSPLPLSSPVIGQNPKSCLSSSCSPVSCSSLPSPPCLSSSPLPHSNETVSSSTPKPLKSSTSLENGQHCEPQSDNGYHATEPDSLEEFIKHETECAQQSNIDPNCDTHKSQPDDCPSQLIIDSLTDSGLCQNLSSSSSDAFDEPSLPKSSLNDQLIENVTSSSLSSISDYNKIDSGVNQTDDLLLIVDCPNDSKGNNLMTNLDSSSLPLAPSGLPSSSSSSHNIVSNNNQNKCFPTHFYVNNADNNNDDDEHVDDDSVDNVTQNDNHDVHNHQKNDIEITSTIEGSALAKGINCGDGIDRPTIIGQLAKPSDNETNGSMLINEENIIELKSSSTSPRDSKLSLVNDQPVSMLVNYDESERFDYQPSPSDEANNLLLIKSNQPLNCSIETCSKSSSPAASPATCLRPLAGIVGKQTGKIVRRESCGIIKSSAESMIAEEIRQLKEREEELARMRLAMSKQQSTVEGHQQLKGGSTMSPLSVSSSSLHLTNSSAHHHQPGHHSVNSHIHHQLGKSTPSHCSSIDGKSSPALSDLSSCSVGTISNDSIDPVPSKPISLEILSSKVSGLLGESPIEREIRISREREAELKAQVNLTRSMSNSIVTNDQHLSTIQQQTTVNQSKSMVVNLTGKEGLTNGNPGAVNGDPIAPSNGPLSKSLSVDETIVTSAGTKLPVFKQNSCGAANAADIQKLLATTRIQQEIEEQTQRELALKATGSIKTISQERTDIEKAGSTYSSITQINTASKAATTLTSKPEELQTAKAIETPSLSGHNGLSGNVSNSIGSSFSSSLVNQSNQVNQINNINTENNSNYNISIIQSNKPTPPLPPPAPSSVSSSTSFSSSQSSLSSSSSSSGATITSIRRTGFQPFMKKGLTKSISMHKFISSKGKTATPTGNPTSSAFYPLASPGDLYNGDLRPPIMVKGDKGFRRGSVSAESKIQEELKEMKAREEELRRQRARLMGLSQPNLALIGRDDDEEGDEDNGTINGNDGDDNAGQTVGLNGSLYEVDAGLKRTTSNPNISHEYDKKVCQPFGSNSKPRKNPLIAQWEKKIIKDNPN
ncbi:uncharacterized protein LOC107364939 isoform X2 [Tetranychus urticae]|nr:uncharacterized protein LOC107364939 isoform X2 [Tetranychus urticae]